VTSTFRPMVSIVIPVFNGADFLSQAIDSALGQTYEYCEVIVVNDGSEDGGITEGIALGYGDRIRYLCKSNGGVASALNLAIQYSSGAYISWLSHDDLYESHKIERQIEALTSMDEKNTILYSDYSIFTDNPNDLLPITLGNIPAPRFRYWIMTENRLHGCTLLIPSLAFKEVGNFDINLKTTQDYDLWFRMSEHFNFVHLPISLVRSRQHEGQGSRTMAMLALVECNQLYIKYLPQLTLENLRAAKYVSVFSAYAAIAGSMTSRGFYDAAKVAREIALQNLSSASPAVVIALRARLLSGDVGAIVIKVLRRLVSKSIKKAVRKLKSILRTP